jgi:hypothetical protein
MNGRRGITLTEVLVAIFVTGLGLISLMTLFPLGALNMAQAIKDDRTAHCAANASAYLRTWWRTQVETGKSDPWGPNYPVYLDPIGVGSVGSTPLGSSIPRVDVPSTWIGAGPNKTANIYAQFTLLDDITFNQNGIANTTPGFLERQGLYSWAYMVRRLNSDPRVLEYEIIVYHGRSLALSGGALSGETTYAASIVQGSNTVTIPGSQNIKRGGWICDGTNGYFYRVRSVTPVAGGLAVVVENPFRASGSSVICMANVHEVFERSTLE